MRWVSASDGAATGAFHARSASADASSRPRTWRGGGLPVLCFSFAIMDFVVLPQVYNALKNRHHKLESKNKYFADNVQRVLDE